jgi:uncharacterized membrane protein YecN with MAPEG domain
MGDKFMESHALVAIVTLLALLLYVFMMVRVGQARGRYGVEAPAITGHPDFERVFRVHANTLEWLPIFLPSLWLFALFWDDRVAAGLGLVWIIGRIFYMTGYTKAAAARSAGFLVQMLAAAVLLFGALGKIIWVTIHPGA